MAHVIYGDKRECLWPALLARQKVRWYKRPKEGETRSQLTLTQVCEPQSVYYWCCLWQQLQILPSLTLVLPLVPAFGDSGQWNGRACEKNNEQQMSFGRVFLFWCQIGPLTIKPLLRTATPWSDHTLPVISHERTSILAVTLPKLWTCPGRAFGSVFISSEPAGWVWNHWIISPLRIMLRLK